MNAIDLANTKLDEAKLYLAEVRSIDVAKELLDQAKTLEFYANQRKGALEAQGNAYELVVHAQRALGRLLVELPKAPAGRPRKLEPHDQAAAEMAPSSGNILSKGEALRSMDISTQDASRMEALAKLPEDEFTKRLETDREKRTSSAASGAGLTATTAASEHDGDSWCTPPEYIELARELLGGIEVDPASNEHAQRVVKAERYYTKDNDGKAQSWRCTTGGLWLNPPYSRGLCEEFSGLWVARREEYVHRNGGGGLLLVNNASDTVWCQHVMQHSTAALYPKGRLAFIDPLTGEPVKGNDRSQALFYAGPKLPAFARLFGHLGTISIRYER
jgi:phage N-6-adenine-methyltransferase